MKRTTKCKMISTDRILHITITTRAMAAAALTAMATATAIQNGAGGDNEHDDDAFIVSTETFAMQQQQQHHHQTQQQLQQHSHSTTTATTTTTAAYTAALHAASLDGAGAAASFVNISGSFIKNLTTTLADTAPMGTINAAAADADINGCASAEIEQLYMSSFGVQLAMPEWEALLTAILLSVIIVMTIVGNILVILSVFTYKPLRIVQNFFIVSLAVADLTVALLVLPFNVAYSILGRWEFGIHLCKMWLTCDILCCTSSILNLCAIALDRYWAITDPINYAQKRTVGRVLLLISGVWILSLLISSPPLLGWNDWPDEFTSATPCELTSQRGYVIYSSLGSFYIPLVIMTIVYIEIFVATRRRLRERAKATKMNTIALKSCEVAAAVEADTSNATGKGYAITSYCTKLICCGRDTSNFSAPMIQNDQESISSETHNIPHSEPTATAAVTAATQPTNDPQHVIVVVKKSRRAKIKDSIKHGKARNRKKEQTAAAAAAQSSSSEERAHNSSKKDKNNATQKLLPQQQQQASSKKCNDDDDAAARLDNAEISTESGSDPKGCIQVCVGAEHEENASLKITPPQSSIGAASNLTTVPLQKKQSGVYQFIEEKQKISLSKERRAARTLGIIMGVFVICWLPFFLMYVILPFCNSCCPTNKFKNFITWLGYINSGLNPVIYTIFNLDYRRAFKRLLGIK